MIKYELVKYTADIHYADRKKIEQCVTYNIPQDKDPIYIKTFTEEKEARKALNKYKSHLFLFTDHNMKYIHVEEYFIECIDYDDDEEYTGNFYTLWAEPCKMCIEIYNTDKNEVEKVFDNYTEAEEYLETQESLEDYKYNLKIKI